MDLSPKLLLIAAASFFFSAATTCSNRECRLLDPCTSDGDCEVGLYCFSCPQGFSGSRCVRSATTNPFKLVNNSLPLNKYVFLTTHNAFAIEGVSRLYVDTYDFEGDVWLCHSFGGKCHDFTAFEPAILTLKEIEAFLSANPAEIVTLILEDYVQTPNGLTKVFTDAGLMKYWFPVTNMPKNGGDWPLVSDMVAKNQRLLVFTSVRSKEQSEGIAYQWNYMVENQYGDGGMHAGNCANRAESLPLDDNTKSLVLVNYVPNIPVDLAACGQNSADLINMLHTCFASSGNRWANFVVVDFYRRSEGGGTFQAVDTLNGELLCGCNDVHACVPGSTSPACSA
ncbi:hypothetical protein CIPAW_04G052700 [Carya illinoinensis]|uniref:PLC-like phosphodiesterases superfamily protein n=1 Tax=Carya illinoinensis TaxID=32201 RepID=A0A8T1QQK2_CARIL|nr:hypothetical protein CIPAW_04G052700 [Carya illinoinensis]